MRNANSPAEPHTLRANEATLSRHAAASTSVSTIMTASSATEWTRLAVTAKSTSMSSLTRGSSRWSSPGRAASASSRDACSGKSGGERIVSYDVIADRANVLKPKLDAAHHGGHHQERQQIEQVTLSNRPPLPPQTQQ